MFGMNVTSLTVHPHLRQLVINDFTPKGKRRNSLILNGYTGYQKSNWTEKAKESEYYFAQLNKSWI